MRILAFIISSIATCSRDQIFVRFLIEPIDDCLTPDLFPMSGIELQNHVHSSILISIERLPDDARQHRTQLEKNYSVRKFDHMVQMER